MQAVLCVILAASVGLAAFVTKERHRSHTRLAGARYVDGVGVKLPDGWILARTDQGSVLFVAVEPDTTDKKGRRLIIEKQRVDPGLSSEEYLQTSGLLRNVVRVTDDPTSTTADPISIAGMPGVMLAVKKPVGGFPFFTPPGAGIPACRRQRPTIRDCHQFAVGLPR
jgi:hypothetical protein